MTVREVLAAAARRFYVILAVVLAFAALAVAFSRDGGSFYTHTTVTFTLPLQSTLLPGSGTTDTSVIAFAGAVATEINGGRPVLTYSSADAPYYGAGLREGVSVGLRNDGNQWMSIFPSATIDIRIVGRNRQWVAEQQSNILVGILAAARGQQSAADTLPEEQITTTIGPLSTEIFAVTASRTDQIMAIAAMIGAALIAGIPAAVIVDRPVRRARSRSAQTSVANRTVTQLAGGRTT